MYQIGKRWFALRWGMSPTSLSWIRVQRLAHIGSAFAFPLRHPWFLGDRLPQFCSRRSGTLFSGLGISARAETANAWTRTKDLLVMSQTSCRCSTPPN